MRAATAYQNEAKTFFHVVSELRHAEREHADPIEISLLLDEIDTMRQYTDSPMIRERCSALLRRHEVSTAGHAG